jgi:hypothetical protein
MLQKSCREANPLAYCTDQTRKVSLVINDQQQRPHPNDD